MKEEKEKQEFEEYLKIKEAFIVEEEGEQAEDEQDVIEFSIIFFSTNPVCSFISKNFSQFPSFWRLFFSTG